MDTMNIFMVLRHRRSWLALVTHRTFPSTYAVATVIHINSRSPTLFSCQYLDFAVASAYVKRNSDTTNVVVLG